MYRDSIGENHRTCKINKTFEPDEIIVGKYRIEELLGEGGFGKVFKVFDMHIRKEFALKTVEGVKNNDTCMEIKMLQSLAHEGLPKLHDIFRVKNVLCIVMDLIEGVTLEAYVKMRGKLSVGETRYFMMKLCEILGYMHSRPVPVIHGDIKPHNIMVREKELQLIDLGGAFFQYDKSSSVYGTKGYAAPEQNNGELFTQSDVYSVGKVMLFMLTGGEAFLACSHLPGKIGRRYGVPNRFTKVINKCLQVEMSSRYQSAKELLLALRKVKGGNRHFPGQILATIGNGTRGFGILIILYCLYLQKSGGIAGDEKYFIMGIYVILCSYLFDLIAANSYKNAILECECSLIVTNGLK